MRQAKPAAMRPLAIPHEPVRAVGATPPSETLNLADAMRFAGVAIFLLYATLCYPLRDLARPYGNPTP